MQFGQARLPAGLTDVTRCERSWMIRAGSHSLSFTRVDYRASFVEERVRDREPVRRWGLMTGVSAVLCVLGGGVTIALAVHSTRAAAGYRYVVSRPVPAAIPVKRVAAVPNHVSGAAPKHVVHPAPSVAQPGEGGADHMIEVIDPAPDYAGTMTAAVAAALASGTLQQWSTADGSERGFVVVGPMEAGEGGCRSLSILVRRGGDNQVERRRECADGGANGVASGS